MAQRNVKVWAAIAVGILAVLAAVAALTLPWLLGQPIGRPTPSDSPGETPPGTTPSPGSSGSPGAEASTTPSGESSPSSAPATTSAPLPEDRAAAVLASMTLEQRVGQVVMVSSPTAGPDGAALTALRQLHIGNVFLKGRTDAGAPGVSAAVAALKGQVTPDATRGVGQFIATDQEGGQVQILRGPGFSAIPSALDQGGMDLGALRSAAAGWGRQLAAVGVNVNLAPVLDTVPSAAFAPQNIPIGHYQRNYGFTPESVSSHGIAFAQGMADTGVAAASKHFPGLGRVTANTDTSTDVTDAATGRHDAYVAPFADAIRAGVPWVMVSNAFYPAIDPDHYAVFSPTVIGGMLRGDLGFRGIVVSDDVCDAGQLAGFAPEHRGADFLAAGGTMVLCTNQQLAPRVWSGIADRAKADPAFAKLVDAAALAVLEAKDRAGLLPR
ncbi:glycoside hydrolase family 3 N-terminal domain-containing protein [Sinomonas sp. P10A9]|uniref:beta-N-acetylhexosaminidase n=1 Tax=Sinomonas puerhi TaxID=3238584 RepID=A0AB39KZM9_9MICC